MPCGRCRAVASEREPARGASAHLVDRAFELLRWGFRAGALGLRGCHVDRPAFGNPLPSGESTTPTPLPVSDPLPSGATTETLATRTQDGPAYIQSYLGVYALPDLPP